MILDSQVFAAALQEGDDAKPRKGNKRKGNKKQDSKKNNVPKNKKVIDKVEI
jgi:hypothetical protein